MFPFNPLLCVDPPQPLFDDSHPGMIFHQPPALQDSIFPRKQVKPAPVGQDAKIKHPSGTRKPPHPDLQLPGGGFNVCSPPLHFLIHIQNSFQPNRFPVAIYSCRLSAHTRETDCISERLVSGESQQIQWFPAPSFQRCVECPSLGRPHRSGIRRM